MKALFIGLGSIGQRHLRNLKFLEPKVEILAVRKLKTAPLLSNENEVIDRSTITDKYNLIEFDDLKKALAKSPDLIFITNPSSMHLDVASKSLETDAFIYMEKPISHNYDGVEELILKEKKMGEKKILVGYQYRCHPAMKLIKRLLNEKVIGNIVSAQFFNGEYLPSWHEYEDYREGYAAKSILGGGSLVTQIHDFDNLINLFGLPSSLFSVGGHLSSLEVDVEDSVHVLMNCSGIPVSVQLNYLQWPPKKEFLITGDKGSIKCNLITTEVTLNNINDRTNEKFSFSDFDRNTMFIDQMKNFLAFASRKQEPNVDLKDATVSLKIALAAKDSILTGEKQTLSWE